MLYFALRVLFYIVVIVGGLVVARLLGPGHAVTFDAIFRQLVIFAVAMSVFANLVVRDGRLLGFGTLRRLLTGRYVQPRREETAFLLIDMRNSTGMAERLGTDPLPRAAERRSSATSPKPPSNAGRKSTSTSATRRS